VSPSFRGDGRPWWAGKPSRAKLTVSIQCRVCLGAETALNESQSEAEAKAKIYYTSCLDTNQTIAKLGAQPLLDVLHRQFSAWTVNWDLGVYDFQDTLEKIHALGMGNFFSFGVGEDEKEPTKNILQASFTSSSSWSTFGNK